MTKNNFQEVSNIYSLEGIDAEISEFYQNPVEQILWSDFVISRGGALSLSEITSLRRGVVIIPLPTSIDNHQVENAKSIEKIDNQILINTPSFCLIHSKEINHPLGSALNKRMLNALTKADFVIANSEFTKNLIIKLGFNDNNIKVINLSLIHI